MLGVLCLLLFATAVAHAEQSISGTAKRKSLLPDDASASMECANIASAHTREVPSPIWGPEAMDAFVRISSQDDHMMNSHNCQAEFQLIILTFKSATLVPVVSSIGDWGRNLTAHLDGFSPDGKRIFGTISEPSKHPLESVFDYDLNRRKLNLVHIDKAALATLSAAKCGSSLAVAGTTESGAIVVEPRTVEACREENRWTIGSQQSELRSLPPGERILDLYHGSRHGKRRRACGKAEPALAADARTDGEGWGTWRANIVRRTSRTGILQRTR